MTALISRNLSTTLHRASVILVTLLAVSVTSCARRTPAAQDPTRLVVAMSTFSEATFLPWNGSTGRKFYLDTIYEYLAYMDPRTLKPQPGLAERWEMSPDGKTYTFWIRRGVQFQEGWGELTSADVKYTLDRIRDPRSIAGPSSPLRKLVANVESPEPFKVVLTLTTPDIDFVSAYLSNALVVPIVCKRYLEQVGDTLANDHPIGTGAYALLEHRKGATIRVGAIKHSQQHWRIEPQFEEIEFRAVPEEFTRAAMLKTGEVDLAPINYDSIKAVDRDDRRVLFIDRNWAPVVRFGGLVPRFANENVPWRDKRVRQALNYAVDKEAIVKAIFHDHAVVVGADFPAPEWNDIAPYPYDPEHAKQLLADAGYPNGFELTLKTFTTVPGAELPIIAEAVALYWAAIGVRAKIVPTNWTSLRGAWTSGNATDIGWTHRGLAFSGTLAGLQASVISASVFSTFANAETDARVDAIGGALDPQTRHELIRDLGLYLREEAAAIFIGFANEPYGASAKIGEWPSLSSQGTNVDLITKRVPPTLDSRQLSDDAQRLAGGN
jgi:peptide/nickel transport system substrate-binding protein